MNSLKNCLYSGLLVLVTVGGVLSAIPTRADQVVHGLATWYGPGFAGNRTASGEIFNPSALTAAHRTLPFGTQVRVTNLNNGRSVVVRINDRLGDPAIAIDLSSGAAQAIGMTVTSQVKMEILGR
jgi:rare lipoprotein A